MNSRTTFPAFETAAKGVRGLVTVYYWIAGILFVLSLLALTTEITLRYCFNRSIPESAEVIVIGFVYVYLFGAAALYGRNEDITIDVVYRMLPETFQGWLMLVVHLAVGVTMGVVLFYTLTLIELQGHLLTPVALLPMSIWYWPLVVATASILFTSSIEVWACLIWIASGSRPEVWPRDPQGDVSRREGFNRLTEEEKS